MQFTLTPNSMSGRPLLSTPPAPSKPASKFVSKLDPRLEERQFNCERRRLERIALRSDTEYQARSRLARYGFDAASADISRTHRGFRIHAWSIVRPTQSICVA